MKAAKNKESMKMELDRDKIQIKNLNNLENFGQVNICVTDKTGTLTKNDLVVRKLYTDGRVWDLQL